MPGGDRQRLGSVSVDTTSYGAVLPLCPGFPIRADPEGGSCEIRREGAAGLSLSSKCCKLAGWLFYNQIGCRSSLAVESRCQRR